MRADFRGSEFLTTDFSDRHGFLKAEMGKGGVFNHEIREIHEKANEDEILDWATPLGSALLPLFVRVFGVFRGLKHLFGRLHS